VVDGRAANNALLQYRDAVEVDTSAAAAAVLLLLLPPDESAVAADVPAETRRFSGDRPRTTSSLLVAFFLRHRPRPSSFLVVFNRIWRWCYL
jgi:hypothetical protein